jgi:uncharacterized protein (TIGR04255 family)
MEHQVPDAMLQNKPLVEALAEIRWELDSPLPNVHVDRHFKILLGRLYDRVRVDYPIHEQLPTATMPDELIGYTVQHRFRRASNDWPLVQVGPGIFSVNATSDYVWDDFRRRAVSAVHWLYEAHPDPTVLKINSLLLRYIDARRFDYTNEDILAFLRDKLHVTVSLPGSLFENASIEPLPQQFALQTAFVCTSPPSTVAIGFAAGQANDEPSLLWETLVRATDDQVPPMPDGFEKWLDAAHTITHDWFFKLIEGDLLEEFRG